MEIDRNGLEVIAREESIRLLESASVGRLALTSGALPDVVPVNFLVDGDRVLLRSGGGTKLAHAMTDAVVALEVDHIDVVSRGGWSVVITGIATEVTDRAALARARKLPVPHWAPTGGDRFVTISLDLVNGRRIPCGAWKPDSVV
jgi:nitroimidazol reductase NimA-like FMN-containing flavoprotein (pyridoxamine 5'-phosphate oxidase superfamily)